MVYALFRLLHFISLLVYAGCVVIKNMALGQQISGDDVANLTRVNKVLALSAGLAVLVGALLWLAVGRPASFYNNNPLFFVKLGLVLILVVLSVPTTRFIRSRRDSGLDEPITVPSLIRISARVELVLIIVTALLAGLMARGIGINP